MGKVKRKSIPSSLSRYLAVCFAVCAAGVLLICTVSGYLEAWSDARLSGLSVNSGPPDKSVSANRIYLAVRYGKFLLIPLWAVLCLGVTVKIFYHKEIKEPVDVLTQAAEKILSDDLDFKVKCHSNNELGMLCRSFEEMKKGLYDSNYELWKSLEERKRLNSAFSHDLRTPVTVLKGYTELAEKFGERLSPEKQADIIRKMSVQVGRLERYTEKMSGLHKLEDIIPEQECCSFGSICGQLRETGSLLCGEAGFSFSADGPADMTVYTDTGLVMQVFENLLGNALRYTENNIECSVSADAERLTITVTDNGKGFSDEALRKAWQPFYRDENADDKVHFGLGLYICRLLCRKCGGDISVANSSTGGGSVSASFSAKKSESR